MRFQRLIPLAFLLTACAGGLDSCSGAGDLAGEVVAGIGGSNTDSSNIHLVNGRLVVVITETPVPSPTPAPAVTVAPYGSTPLPPEPCIRQPDGSGLSAYSRRPCAPLMVSIRSGMAIPTPAIARDMGDGWNQRVYGGWEPCHYGADNFSQEADGGGVCPWTTAGGYPSDDPRSASQVGK